MIGTEISLRLVINRMFQMSIISFDARSESFEKAQKRFADCFTLHNTAIFGSATFCGFG